MAQASSSVVARAEATTEGVSTEKSTLQVARTKWKRSSELRASDLYTGPINRAAASGKDGLPTSFSE